MKPLRFRDARVLDGTGRAPYRADVLVTGNRIAAITPAFWPMPR